MEHTISEESFQKIQELVKKIKRRFIKGTNGKTMAMPLSQLFEVLFDSSVVVKYPIF
ncbi:hypothetical protein [Lachnospira pectinoschiza]|uniref:hypothetical protein n=1 Tax=Lachnospira pectinoschiza TaxID=28052 RepID=UPI002221696C|nr:hypothetical protein [Lachnospira pectinoschiza]